MRDLSDEKQLLLALALACGFLLGLLATWVMVQGMRRGQVRIRGHWFNKREDGFMFYIATGMYAAAGIGMMVCAVLLAMEWFGL